MNPKIRASVVVASRDRPEELQKCLQSVLQAITADDEIIVIDSASADAKAVSNVAVSSGARLIRTKRGGSARARNIGIRHARGDVIAFTDDDALVDVGWLEALMSRFSSPNVGAVVGPVFKLGSAPPALLLSCADFDPANDVVAFNRLQEDWFARVHFGGIGSGANLAVRRSAFERHGLFRENLGRGAPISGDENYYLLTLVECGETVVNEPAARVYHPPQPLERLRELKRCRIAYLLYILITRPRLRWLSIARLISRFRGQRSFQPTGRASVSEFGRALISAPALLYAACRSLKHSKVTNLPERVE